MKHKAEKSSKELEKNKWVNTCILCVTQHKIVLPCC